MKRTLFLTYSAVAYVLALGSLAYLMGFLVDVGVPKGINDGPVGSFWPSVLIDAAMISLFGLHHSITARASFKGWWTRIIPRPIERATYLYMTVALTYLLVDFWQPIPETLWRTDNQVISAVIFSAYLATWAMMLASTFHFGHLSFFGVSQALDRFRNRPEASVPFAARYLYALMRHPISLGWMLMPWLTPHFTVGQLVWALSVTAYVLIATKYEEADLIAEIGDDYRRYREEVPAYIPGAKPDA
ncbi:MAG: isoprenylcysteine carboxylmethyltransferase family protein [Gammaproteobacteria bacterium]|nr:isoprenylcysteine carboxylmethyltransferase family protein [Gammaproteobacteria bacterium]MDH5215841.1 isoprenylcysteine carboxylmethyltransferase family protein [Gammaproteobacteria bacterium]MDH5502274.1 isoprenylcysteine carboxylmethyltransferase family protein [Gammaproteobacteria bacterium]